MNITKEYIPGMGVVVTVENPPLPTEKHTIVASAIADGSVVLEDEIARLTNEANEKLAIHQSVLDLLGG